MIAQGIAQAPGSGGKGRVSRAESLPPNLRSLILATPASNIAYQIHPGVDADRQRIKIGGYVGDGSDWAELRLVKDGEILATDNEAGRIETWWTLTPGEHRFWLEGRANGEEEVERTAPALVIVEEFVKDLARSTP
jgi:hypothetical protein